MNNNGGGVIGEKKEEVVERRRRIAERGSDRMALITGRINALPPQPPSATSSPTYRQQALHGQSLSMSPFDTQSEDLVPARLSRPHSLASSAFSLDFEDSGGGAEETKHDASIASSRLRHQGGFKNPNTVEKIDEKVFESQDSDTISEINNQPSKSSRPKEPAAVASNPHQKPPNRLRWQRHTFFSSRDLNFSILSSENERALCSLIMALLVVFYHKISKGFLFSKPLYMVLITDITIVIARIYRAKVRLLQGSDGEMVEARRDMQSWGDAVKLLERGLVAYQAVRGVFIDCSIYLVVVVCGISLIM